MSNPDWDGVMKAQARAAQEQRFSSVDFTSYPGTTLIDYPFPLRGGEILAHFILPRDLSINEARKIAAFLETLVDVNKTSEP